MTIGYRTGQDRIAFKPGCKCCACTLQSPAYLRCSSFFPLLWGVHLIRVPQVFSESVVNPEWFGLQANPGASAGRIWLLYTTGVNGDGTISLARVPATDGIAVTAQISAATFPDVFDTVPVSLFFGPHSRRIEWLNIEFAGNVYRAVYDAATDLLVKDEEASTVPDCAQFSYRNWVTPKLWPAADIGLWRFNLQENGFVGGACPNLNFAMNDIAGAVGGAGGDGWRVFGQFTKTVGTQTGAFISSYLEFEAFPSKIPAPVTPIFNTLAATKFNGSGVSSIWALDNAVARTVFDQTWPLTDFHLLGGGCAGGSLVTVTELH